MKPKIYSPKFDPEFIIKNALTIKEVNLEIILYSVLIFEKILSESRNIFMIYSNPVSNVLNLRFKKYVYLLIIDE